MFSIIQPLFLQKPNPLYSQIFFWEWDLNLGRKELEIYPPCVRSPWFRPNKQGKGGNIHAVYKLTKVQAR